MRAVLLRGWVDLTVEPKTKREADYRENSIQYFDQVKEYVRLQSFFSPIHVSPPLLSYSSKDCEYLLGMAKYHDTKKAYPKALECFDEVRRSLQATTTTTTTKHFMYANPFAVFS